MRLKVLQLFADHQPIQIVLMASIICVLTLSSVLFLTGLDTAPVLNLLDQNKTVDGKDLEYAEPEPSLNEDKSSIFESAENINDFNNFNVSSRGKRSGLAPQCGVDDSSNHGVLKWDRMSLTYFIANDPSSPSVSSDTVQQVMKRAFNEWSKATNLNFRQVDELPADINIVFGYSQHNNRDSICNTQFASNILAHAYFPETGEIHFNSAYYFDSHGVDAFFTTAVHEIGHALGLDHMHNSNSVMYPYFVKNFNELPTQDQENIQMMYGKRPPVLPVRQQATNNQSSSIATNSNSRDAVRRIADYFNRRQALLNPQ